MVFGRILGKLVDSNEKQVRQLQNIVDQINLKETEYQALSEADLKANTELFRQRLQAGESVDDLLVEAFATVKNACRRLLGRKWEAGGTEITWDMVPFDVQMIGGIVLHQGKIAEMKTGEGKTLVATMPLYLNALSGKGAHLVTVNDYLARRDAEWMGELYRYLGLSIGIIQHGMQPSERQAAYAADITYGTNNEYGFDYLRDNMVPRLSLRVQRDLHFAIVDEVDSILIDEARTPLIISGQRDEESQWYEQFARLMPRLDAAEDYIVDEKANSAALTEAGIAKMEGWLGVDNLYDVDVALAHYLDSAIKAHALFKRDKDYVVKDDEVVIVDEFTGRLMPGRRYSEGLHQAIEAKEGVVIQKESQTLATITFQNFFRMYDKLSGMTGTAETEAEEFDKIYSLDVVVIPTNRPISRKDHNDLIFKNQRGKLKAITRDIKERHATGQPILVGTIAVETSELVSQQLQKAGIPHNVLNAKNHGKEAMIVADAGKRGAVTIATNMAGRGTDIKLGGQNASPEQKQEILDLGGLYVVGTERHESRRIDNQLRGRSGRQGESGGSRFYVALDDDLMRIFGGDRVAGMMQRLGIEEDMPIENPLLNRSLESAQKRVEGHNFDIRKHLVEYDDVMNRQREVIYSLRRQILETAEQRQPDNTQAEVEQAPVLAKDLAESPLKGLEAAALIESFEQQLERNRFSDKLHVLTHQPNLPHVILFMMWQTLEEMTSVHLAQANHPDADPEADNWSALVIEIQSILPLTKESQANLSRSLEQHDQAITEHLLQLILEAYRLKESNLGQPIMRDIERVVLLQTIDRMWTEHLDVMGDLRQGIGLRGYGQRDPLVEYKSEAYKMFQGLIANLETTIAKTILRIGVRTPESQAQAQERMQGLKEQGATLESGFKQAGRATSGKEDAPQPIEKTGKYDHVGRNDPCPCGSGKKFKKCHGRAI